MIEPVLPTPLLAVIGESPAARTLGELARIDRLARPADGVAGADAVVVATMGHGDEDALADALGSEAGYVGLVASSKRAATVLATLRDSGLDEESVLRVRAPAGLDLGPSSQEEIAVAILAELVAWKHMRSDSAPAPEEGVDPVCGMTVAVSGPPR